MKSLIIFVALGACVASAANIPSAPNAEPFAKSEVTARGGGWGGGGGGGGSGGGWGGNVGWGGGSEIFSGPTPIFFAPVIAVVLIAALWVAAYNTLRSGPPKVGFGAGAQGVQAGGWGGAAAAGGWGAAPVAAGGWGAASGYPEYDISAAGSSPQAAAVASAVQQTVAATGSRSLNDLTHRVLTSIERQEQAQHS